jgi:putative oxidoreductase
MSFSNSALPHLKRRYENVLVVLLRLSIAIVFIWFGLLKVFGYNPVFDLVNSVMPVFASGTGLIVLGWFETAIGVGLIINRFRSIVHILLVLHLAGTFLTFITAPELVFIPAFPILSLAGEFVVKNLVLAIAGMVVLLHESHRKRSA